MVTDGALAGIRVLDLTRVVSGPYAAMILGDHGAEVIKVEEPGRGDETRAFPPFVSGESTYFMSLNRNKKSIVLDLKQADDRGRVLELVASADVLLHNFRPRFAAQYGLDYESVSRLNPRLVYCAISGYGPTGPYSERPAYGLFVAGIGGLMSVTGEPGGPPQRPGINVIDFMAGLNAALGVTLALQARGRTGRGQKVDVSLLDGLVATAGHVLTAYSATGKLPVPTSHNQHAQIVPYGTFLVADGYVNVGVVNEKFWAAFCRAVDRPEWIADPRFNTNVRRVEHKEELLELLRPLFRSRTAEEWLAALEAHDVPCSPINGFDRVIEDPQVRHNGMLAELDHLPGGRIVVPGIPIRLSDTPGKIRLPPPTLGQHDEILGERAPGARTRNDRWPGSDNSPKEQEP